MQQELARTGRKMVTIVDPHLRAEDDYTVFAQAKARQLLVRTADSTTGHMGLQSPLDRVAAPLDRAADSFTYGCRCAPRTTPRTSRVTAGRVG